MRTRTALALGLAWLFVAACTSSIKDRIAKARAEAESTSAASGGGGSSGEGDPCTLLDSAEVAAAIGPLAGPPYRGGPIPEASSSTCEYDTKDYRRIRVDVDWSGGKMAMKMMAFARNLTDKASQAETQTGTVLKSGDTLRGNWDAVAQTPMQCCSLDALKGDQHVQLDWAGTHLTFAQAGVLLDSAIARLGRPLKVDGTAGIPAAKQRWADMAKDSAIDACSLVSQKDAEAILGTPLSSPPDHGTPQTGTSQTSCYYRTAMPSRMPNSPPLSIIYEIDVKEWNDAHAKFAEDQYVINGVAGGMRRQIAAATGGDTAAPKAPPMPPGPWDEIGDAVGMGDEAVKGPIMLVASTIGDHAKERALLAKAVSALK